MGTEIGAYLDGNHAGTEQLTKDLNLALGKLAIQVERTSHIHVVDVVDHRAMPALFDAIELRESAQEDTRSRVDLTTPPKMVRLVA